MTKETYGRMKFLLVYMQYDDHKWHICGPVETSKFLFCLQPRLTKRMCFLFVEAIEPMNNPAVEWFSRPNFAPENFIVKHLSLVDKKIKNYLRYI